MKNFIVISIGSTDSPNRTPPQAALPVFGAFGGTLYSIASPPIILPGGRQCKDPKFNGAGDGAVPGAKKNCAPEAGAQL